MEDEEIIELYFSRSEKAIEETSRKYHSFCYSVANRVLRSNEETEECINDVYLKLWNTIPPQRPQCLMAYIGRIVKNISISKWRSNNSLKHNSGKGLIQLSELAECVDMETDIESENDRAELAETVTEFIRGLKEIKQRIFIQRYWYMMDIKEIAENNNLGESKVKMTLMRTRNELKDYLSEKGLY